MNLINQLTVFGLINYSAIKEAVRDILELIEKEFTQVYAFCYNSDEVGIMNLIN